MNGDEGSYDETDGPEPAPESIRRASIAESPNGVVDEQWRPGYVPVPGRDDEDDVDDRPTLRAGTDGATDTPPPSSDEAFGLSSPPGANDPFAPDYNPAEPIVSALPMHRPSSDRWPASPRPSPAPPSSTSSDHGSSNAAPNSDSGWAREHREASDSPAPAVDADDSDVDHFWGLTPDVIDEPVNAGADVDGVDATASPKRPIPRRWTLTAVVLLAVIGLVGLVVSRSDGEPGAVGTVESGRLPADVEELWAREVGRRLEPNAVAAADDLVVFVAFDPTAPSRSLVALDGQTGEEVWVRRLSSESPAQLVMATDSTIVVSTEEDDGGRLVGYDAQTGDLGWEHRQSDRYFASRFFAEPLVIEPSEQGDALVLTDPDTGRPVTRTSGEFVPTLFGRIFELDGDDLFRLDHTDDAGIARGAAEAEPELAATSVDAVENLVAFGDRIVRIEQRLVATEIGLDGERPIEVRDVRTAGDRARDGELADEPVTDGFFAVAIGDGRCLLQTAAAEVATLFGCALVRDTINIEWSVSTTVVGFFVSERGIVLNGLDTRAPSPETAAASLIDASTGETLVEYTGTGFGVSVNAADGVVVPVRDPDEPVASSSGVPDPAALPWSGFDLDGNELWTLDPGLEPVVVGDGVVITVDRGGAGRVMLRGHGETSS